MRVDDDRVASGQEVHGKLEDVRLHTANVRVEKVAHEQDAKAAPRGTACTTTHDVVRRTIRSCQASSRWATGPRVGSNQFVKIQIFFCSASVGRPRMTQFVTRKAKTTERGQWRRAFRRNGF
jgi:hypothetical protein